MDGPLISTQQTVVENNFNPKQRPERLHLTVGNLEYDVIPSKPDSNTILTELNKLVKCWKEFVIRKVVK